VASKAIIFQVQFIRFSTQSFKMASSTQNHIMEELQALATTQGISSLNDLAFAKYMDQRDPLARFRDQFNIPKLGKLLPNPPAGKENEDCSYFCGNSLGLLPKETPKLISEEFEVWTNKAVNGHFDHTHTRPWVSIDETVKDETARLVGGSPLEVAIMNSLTVNLHLLLCSFYQPTPQRYKIMFEEKAFPSDHFAMESQAKLHGYSPSDALVLVSPRENEFTLRTEAIVEKIEKEGDSIAVVCFSGVQYYTGQFFDIQKITEAAHKKGCLVGFDLAHAVGNVPLKLSDWGVDFACWCSYKYLNSGPGGIAGIFVHKRHARDFDRNRLVGWWAHEKGNRFLMENRFSVQEGAAGFQQSNPCVLATVALLGSLKVFSQTSMEDLRKKSLLLTGYLDYLLKSELKDKFQIITPSNVNERGCQLSLLFSSNNIKQVHDLLESKGIICDKREPNVLRVAPVPLYNTFADVHKFVNVLQEVLKELKE